jgi:hypothetical protein
VGKESIVAAHVFEHNFTVGLRMNIRFHTKNAFLRGAKIGIKISISNENWKK